MEKAERMKRKQDEKNQEKVKKIDAMKNLEVEQKLQRMLQEQQMQSKALMEQLREANEKAEREEIEAKKSKLPDLKYVEICYKCKSDRHRVADCPLNFCKSCGEQGHEVIYFFRP